MLLQGALASRSKRSPRLTIRTGARVNSKHVSSTSGVSRRQFIVVLASGVSAVLPADPQTGGPPRGAVACRLTVNGQPHDLLLDPRVTLLDLLREHLALTGTKK